MTAQPPDLPTFLLDTGQYSESHWLAMSAHHDSSEAPPATKKAKMDNGPESGSYIPTEEENGPQFSVVFSMKEEKGALVKALELCKVLSGMLLSLVRFLQID